MSKSDKKANIKIKCPKCGSPKIAVLSTGTVYCKDCEIDLIHPIFKTLFALGMDNGEEL